MTRVRDRNRDGGDRETGRRAKHESPTRRGTPNPSTPGTKHMTRDTSILGSKCDG
jgi:hypothetical protein